MKHNYFYRICGVLFVLAFAGACGLETQDECLSCGKIRNAELRLSGTLPATGLTMPLYLFRRPAGTYDDYVFERSYASVADGETLKLPLSELRGYDYRFLMVAQPDAGAWLAMRTAAGTAFAPGTAWSDVRLTSAAGAAASEGYCGVTDMSGEEILIDGNIRLTLTRIAGQVLFDFFRTGGSLSQPQGVVSADVESVIDRVSGIEIAYENPTTALRFDENGQLIPAAYAQQPLRQTITPQAADFKVTLPQEERGLGIYDASLRGSLRIAGAFLMPSDAKLRIKMVFTYYDTTPACGNDHAGDHTADCYALRQVTLGLPSAAAPAGLPVAADCFTINRAGIRCDRIIDVPVGTTIETDFSWL